MGENLALTLESRLVRRVLRSRIAGLSPSTLYLALSAFLFVWLVWSLLSMPLATYMFGADYWEHTAAIKEWSGNLWNPGNPHLDIDTKSPRYMPYFFVVAVFVKLTGLSVISALNIAGIFNGAIFFTGIFLFFRTYFRSEWAPVLGLVILLTVWGTGWNHSNEYQLRTLFYIASYPSMFALSLTLVTLTVVLKSLRGEASKLLLCATLLLLFPIIFLSHPLTSAFTFGAIGILAVTERGAKLSERVLTVLLAVVGLAVAEFWPYFSVFSVVLGGGSTGAGVVAQAKPAVWDHYFYAPSWVLPALGPALAGIPGVLYLAWRREHLFIVLGAFAMMGVYWSRFFLFQDLPIWVTGRFLFFAVFFFHMSLVAVLLRSAPYWRLIADGVALPSPARVLAGGSAILIAAGILWNGAFASAYFFYSYFRLKPVAEILKPVVNAIPENAVVLAKPEVEWPIPTFAGKVVSLKNSNPMVVDQEQRALNVRMFFDASTDSIKRKEILKRYKVTYVLIAQNDTPESVIKFLALVSKVQSKGNGYTLFKLF